MEIYVLARVHKRHPEITEEDVVTAFFSAEIDIQRRNGSWMRIGLDGKGRDIEIIYRVTDNLVMIFHAMSPPTKKFVYEIDMLRRK